MLRYSLRQVEVGTPLHDGTWESTTVVDLGNPSQVDLALDRTTGTPYIAYSAYPTGTTYLATHVGADLGNCGTDLAWHCESINSACGEEFEDRWFLQQRIELESELGQEADAAHVVAEVAVDGDERLLLARKDLLTQSWTCKFLGGEPLSHMSHLMSAPIYHDHDARLKPQILYSTAPDPDDYVKAELRTRSLLDYVGTPLPPLSWTPEFSIVPYDLQTYETMSFAIRDEGLADSGPGEFTGIGVPAIVEYGDSSLPTSLLPSLCSYTTPWTLRYRVADNPEGSSWQSPEKVLVGTPCNAQLVFGWEASPHIVYTDRTLGRTFITARRPDEPQLWTNPEVIASSTAAQLSAVYDPDIGSISAIYTEFNQSTLHIVDGYLL